MDSQCPYMGAFLVGMSGLGNGIINVLLTAGGYNAFAAVQGKGVKDMLVLCYLGIELICYAVIFVMLNFLTVEKHTERGPEDHSGTSESGCSGLRGSLYRTGRTSAQGTGRSRTSVRRNEKAGT